MTNGRRKCEKGKPCGATCIDRREICRKELQDNVSKDTGKVSDLVGSRGNNGGAQLSKLTTTAEFNEKLKNTEGNYSPRVKEMHGSSGKLLGEEILSKSYVSEPTYKDKEEEEKFKKLRQSLFASMGEKDVSEAFYTLRNYTGGKYADYRNAQLGRTNSPDDLKRAELLERLVKSKEFEKPEVEKFRGKRVDNLTLSGLIQSARSGGTFADKALASWSTDLEIAQSFADKNTGRNNRVIYRAVNKNGVPIGSISSVGYENEILTPSGSNYRYLGYTPIKVGSQTYHVFDVEES
jgi:hypothetical protein